MNNKIIIAVSSILVFSLIINGYLYTILVQTENDATAQIRELENERNSFSAETTALTAERDEMLSQINTVSSERYALETQIDALNSELTSLIKERDNLRTQVLSLTNERDRALSEVKTYSDLNTALALETNTLKDEKDKLQTQIASLTQQRDESLANVASLDAEIAELQAMIDDLTAEIPWEFGEDEWSALLNGGSYSVNDKILLLQSANAQVQPRNYVEVYKCIDTSNGSGFLISYEIKADTLGGFALKLSKNQPFFGSTDCINFEMSADGAEGKGFQISRWVSSWTWDTFAQPQEGNWYRIQINVQRNPESLNDPQVTYTIYQGTEFSYSATANDMTNITFWDIRFIVLECWAGPCQYQIKDFNIEY